MKVRDHLFINARTLSDSDTITENLKSLGKIQYLRCIYQATNGATSNTLGKLNGMVSKLEVNASGENIDTVSMKELQALNYYMGQGPNGRDHLLPFQQLNSKAAGTVIEEAIINFGRFLGDRDYYFDTARFANPQLKLTHALTISATAGFATGSGRLTVIARVIEEGAPPARGFITAKEVKSWTTAASGDVDTDLLTDAPYVGLLVKDLETLIEPDVDISNVKLFENAETFVHYNLSTTQILQGLIEKYPPAMQRLNFLNDTAVTWLSDIYGRSSAWMGPIGGTAKGGVSTVTAEQVVASMTTGDTGSLFINVQGYAPHSCLWLPFGDGLEPDDFLKPAGLNLLRLRTTDGGAGGAAAVVAVQARA
jgi:hypothetical protein